MEEPLRIRIRDVNPHIVCSLCAGYYIEATTVTECLHTFCKSCIVKCLQNSKNCPQCNLKIHETQPLANLKPDRVMQDIIYKLVPGLFENEEKRRVEFFKSRGLVKESKVASDTSAASALSSVYDDPTGHYFHNDQLISICLEKYSHSAGGTLGYVMPMLPKKFVRCSVRTRIQHIQFLLRKKLGIPRNLQVEILCGSQVLEYAMSLKQISLMYWANRPSPVVLYYRIRPVMMSQDLGIR